MTRKEVKIIESRYKADVESRLKDLLNNMNVENYNAQYSYSEGIFTVLVIMEVSDLFE